jgi:hypothetical protein
MNNSEALAVELCRLCPQLLTTANAFNLSPTDIAYKSGHTLLAKTLVDQQQVTKEADEFALIDDDFLWLNETTGIQVEAILHMQKDEDSAYIEEQDEKIKTLADNIIAAIPARIKSNAYDYRSSSITSDYETLTTTSTSPTTTFHIDSPPSTEEFCKYFHVNIQNDFKQLTLNNQEQRELYEAALTIQSAYRRYLKRKRTRELRGDGETHIKTTADCETAQSHGGSDSKQYVAACVIQKYFRRYKQVDT